MVTANEKLKARWRNVAMVVQVFVKIDICRIFASFWDIYTCTEHDVSIADRVTSVNINNVCVVSRYF